MLLDLRPPETLALGDKPGCLPDGYLRQYDSAKRVTSEGKKAAGLKTRMLCCLKDKKKHKDKKRQQKEAKFSHAMQ